LYLDVASSSVLCLVVVNSSGLCLVIAGSLWFVIIPKSKDQFMEQPPIKMVQLWSLYGYGLAQYVVETSLDVQTGSAECVGDMWVWL
jgi:hypothetical protein